MTAIPGMTVTINLPTRSVVAIAASGVQRTTTQNDGTFCHVGYSATLNGTLLGDPTWGDRIQVSQSTYSWHSTWKLNRAITLMPGTYTVGVAANTANFNCYVCAESGGSLTAYDSCNMTVTAVPVGG